MQDPYFGIMDSIRTAEGFDRTSYAELPEKEQLAYGKIGREIANQRVNKPVNKKNDSLMQLQIVLDNSNTEKLIKVTQEFGWPLKSKTGCTQPFVPALVFRHAQPQYHETIINVIDKALKEGQIEKFEYTFILNHINGREDYEKTKEKADKIEIQF